MLTNASTYINKDYTVILQKKRQREGEIMANAKSYLYLFNLLQNREMYTRLVLL